ncbi:MAG: radical SAM protein [Clostridia bacterium]|nr:radical SAM protein [Clostridia bacterium]
MPYQEITCNTAIGHLKRQFPYAWNMNPYRGCAHGCRYCFAMYSHRYLDDSGDYFNDIYVKTNIVDRLELQLRRPSWKREIINIGGVADCYQPAEAHYQLMPEILKLLIRYRTPCIICTKSTLVLRDYDLIDELSRLTYVNVAATVTCMDENIRKKLEPGGAPSSQRFAMLKEFSKTNVSTGLHVMPIIPYLTDNEANLRALFAQAADCRVGYVLPGTLYLRGNTRQVFFSFIQEAFPALYEPLTQLYKKGSAGKDYKDRLYQMVNKLRRQYGLSSSYSALMREKMPHTENRQLSMFDD